jgi:hypothetical protein
MPNLDFSKNEAERVSGSNKELAQLPLVFHVEQLRETVKDVKHCYRVAVGNS